MTTTAKTTTTPATPDTAHSLTYEQMYTDYQTYCRGIVKWICSHIDRDTVDDLVSDAFERLYRNWSKVAGQPPRLQKGYLARIVVNRVTDFGRRRTLEQATFVSLDGMEMVGDFDTDALSMLAYHASGGAVTTDSPERIYLAREELDEIKSRLMERATGGERMYNTMLLEAAGYSLTEIAAARGRSHSAVKMDMMRGREHLGVKERKPRVHRYSVTVREGTAA